MHTLPDTVVVASGNVGKLREIEAILGDLNIKFIPQSQLGVSEAEETGATFAENALL